jgi:hypothetical protein
MRTLTNRKRGGQPGNRNAVGNQNAVNHSYYTAAVQAARWAAWQEQCRCSDQWCRSQPQTDYGAIYEALERAGSC